MTRESTPDEERPTPPTRRAAREAERHAASEPSATPGAEASSPAASSGGSGSAPGPAASDGAPAADAASPRSATLDDLFTPDGEERASSRPKRKRRGGCLLIGLLILVVLGGGIALGATWVMNTYGDRISEFMGWDGPADYEDGQAEGEAVVTITDGEGGMAISQSLHDAGVTRTPDAFYDLLVGLDEQPTFYPGVYRLQLKMTSAAALEALQDPESKLEDTVQLREGLTVEASLEVISESMEMPLKDLRAAVEDPSDYGVEADTLEGWLYPATYTFEPKTKPADVIRTLVDRTSQSLDAAEVPAEDRQRILTIASIIQREARFEEDFYKVSRVIQNRLDGGNPETGGYLQMDSTTQYGYGEIHDGTASTSEEAREDDNPWNTYMYPGLPAGPISNPGDVAIDAAMHPADGPWLYFVTVNLDTGETVFTDNYADHQRYVQEWVQWCGEHPDSGC